MSFVLGMTLTAILLIGCAGGGIWYWLKIKEAPKKIKQDKSPLAGKQKEPFLRSEKEKRDSVGTSIFGSGEPFFLPDSRERCCSETHGPDAGYSFFCTC